jgi:hypothetical protein
MQTCAFSIFLLANYCTCGIHTFITPVEFQSYPSMKWKPAQFEMCVVQQVGQDSYKPTIQMQFFKHCFHKHNFDTH